MFKKIRPAHQLIFKKVKYQTVETNLTTKKLTLVDHQKSQNYYDQFKEIEIKKPFRKS